MDKARLIALQALTKLEKDKSYSNILIDQMLISSKLNERDKAFATAIFYGVIEQKLTLDYVIGKYSNIPLESVSSDILNILRMGVYQIKYMDRTPNSAVVNESVKLVYFTNKESAKGFVNAVLRTFVRRECDLRLPNKKTDEILYYSIKYSCPKWLLEQYINDYGKQNAIDIVKDSISRPPLYFRVNTIKISTDDLIDLLSKKGIKATKNEYLQDVIETETTKSIENMEEYKNGFFYVQDISSGICAMAVDAKPSEKVLDVCSAPGGKSFTISQLMKNKGQIVACDLHKNRVKLVDDGAKRLGISIIKPVQSDASKLNEDLGVFDKVLCDVPCAGHGVIRRKPEIKYKSEESLEGLFKVQYQILLNSSNYVKNGGKLIYSTCSLSKRENEQVIEAFLKENKKFRLTPLPSNLDFINEDKNSFITLLPSQIKSDGFFIATFEKVGE